MRAWLNSLDSVGAGFVELRIDLQFRVGWRIHVSVPFLQELMVMVNNEFYLPKPQVNFGCQMTDYGKMPWSAKASSSQPTWYLP